MSKKKKVDQANFSIFEQLCRKHFNFLEAEFKCRVDSVERNACDTYITYKNKTTAIVVSLEPREGGIFIRLVRIVNGKLPPYPITLTTNTPLHWFDLDDLITLRAPTLKVDQPFIDALFKQPLLEQIVKQYALALRQCAEDILTGQLQVLDQLEKIVKKRARKLEEEES